MNTECMKNKLENAIWGFVVGDCLGVPYEFKEKGTFKYVEMKGYGTHNQPPMTWSDDTAMMLTLIDSYENNSFNIEKHKNNLKEMLNGKYTVDNTLFDVGIGTFDAINKNFIISDEKRAKSLGNGGLARCWLIGLLDREKFKDFISLTHSVENTYMQYSMFYIDLLELLLNSDNEEIAIRCWKEKNFNAWNLLNKTTENKYLNKCEGSIVQTVNLVLNSFIKGKNMKWIIEQGGDTDSNAALFGALYFINKEKIPLRYLRKIRAYEKLAKYISF